LNYRLNFYKI